MAQHHGLMDVDLEEQVAALRRELGALKKIVARRSSDFYDDASDTVSSYLGSLSGLAPSVSGIRRQARVVEKMTYDHPAVVAGIGLLVIGLLATLVVGMRPSQKPVRRQIADRGTRPNSRSRASRSSGASPRNAAG